MAQSLGPNWIDWAAASNGARPVKWRQRVITQQAEIRHVRTGRQRGGHMVRPAHHSGSRQRSIAGILAACSGVRPPSADCGSSAQPSGMTITYFITGCYTEPGERKPTMAQ